MIPEAENVADSEDSEDEWNYYRIDPNKKESATTAESSEDIEKQNTQDPESVLKGGSEVQSSKVEVDIKCEGSEEEIPSLKLVNIDVNTICIIVFSWKNFCHSIYVIKSMHFK